MSDDNPFLQRLNSPLPGEVIEPTIISDSTHCMVPPNGERWNPTLVGDLFILVMPNKSKMLMRVTEIDDPTHWNSTQASIDDAMTATANLPYVYFGGKSEGVPH